MPDIVKKFFFFDTMLTPKVVTILYWLTLAGIALYSIPMIFSSDIITGLFVFACSVFGARISYELLIVIFKIHEDIHKIAHEED